MHGFVGKSKNLLKKKDLKEIENFIKYEHLIVEDYKFSIMLENIEKKNNKRLSIRP